MVCNQRVAILFTTFGTTFLINMKNFKFLVIKNMSYNLLHILIKNKCLHAYVKNAYIEVMTRPEHRRHYSRSSSELIFAFMWKNTKEGWEFWNKINDQLTNNFRVCLSVKENK